MAEYLSPGVYVEEVESGARPIEAVGTSTAGFVGQAPKIDARVNEAVAVTNWTQFRSLYVGEKDKSTPLAQAVLGFFLNGGARCYIVNTGQDDAITGNGKGLDVLEKLDDVAIIAAPGKTDAKSYDALLTSAEKTGDRFAILDSPLHVPDINRLTQVARVSAKPPEDAEAEGSKGGLRARESPQGCGAQIACGIVTRDALDPNQIIETYPSGYVAGIYARTDFRRGVHKAPANEIVRGALDVTQPITKADQAVLNPASVNCLRFFSREGVKLYGARTLAASSSENRYVNVKRLMMLIRLSIERGTGWVVFEPNDYFLWAKIKRDVSAFLTILWRQGALMGATPEEAFFVKCDRETNPQETIDAGQVITVIGVAPVKPAEFVIFKIGQTPSGAYLEAA
ncbi:MAG TPA: phage tail sheath subtilisin-like domain-containing protein [Gammaproteobacteria bacterium]